MATGSSSLDGGNDEIFDFSCSKCEEDGKYIEAKNYCSSCPSYLCHECLQQHRRFLKDHEVLDETRKENWGTVKTHPLTGNECILHNGQSISMFCAPHDALCCPVCVSLNHRNCKDMCYIPQIAKGVTKSTEFQQLLTKIDQILPTIEKAVSTKKEDQSSLNGSYEKVFADIAAIRSRINTALDKLEEQVKTKVNDMYRPIDDDISNELLACARFAEDLQVLRNDLHQTEHVSENDMFIKMKTAQKKVSGCEQVVKRCSATIKPKLSFIENAQMLQDIWNETYLGEVEYETERTNKLYKMTKNDKVDVSLSDDPSTCYVDGLCQMPDGQIVLTDKYNNRVKVLDSSYKVTRYCSVPDKPFAVCCTGEKEVATALASQTIQLIEISNGICLTNSIKLGHECLGLAYNDGKFFVTDKVSRVYIYEKSGALQRTIQTDISGADIFTETRHIAVSSNGSRLYVTDRPKGIVVLDSDGNHVSTFENPKLIGSRGVCLDNHGNVFLICCMSHNIAQLEVNGKEHVGMIVEQKDGIKFPGIAVFDKTRSVLLVTSGFQRGFNKLHACYLEPV